MTTPHHPPQSSESQSGHSRRSYPSWISILTLGIIALLLVGFWLYSERLIGSLEYQARRISELQTELEVQREALNILKAKHVAIVPLTAARDFPALSGRMIIDTDRRRAVVFMANFPKKDSSQLILWIPGSAMTVPLDSSGKALVNLSDLQPDNAYPVIVTLEPLNPPPKPSGPFVAEGLIPSAR